MKKKWVQTKGCFRKNLVITLGVMMVFCVAGAVQAAQQPPQPPPPSRFQEVEGSNGSIVRDNTTGLEWQRCPHGQSWTGSGCSGIIWEGRWYDARRLTASGGFVLPTIDFLKTLAPYDQNIFPGDGYFWSSSPAVYYGSINEAWCFVFRNGRVSSRHKDFNFQVRLVRFGQ